MISYLQGVRRVHGERLGNQGAELVNKIINAANRLDELIQDLLTLNRVAQQPIHLGAVVSAMISELPALQEPNATVSIVHRLHKVFGHRASLIQCFSNLLLNAAKFVKPGVHPTVKVWSEPFDGRIRIWVEDNGISIPVNQRERIFGLFQRLHRNRSWSGDR